MVGLQKRLQRYFNLLNLGFDFNEEIKSKGVILRSKEREIEEGENVHDIFLKRL